MKKIIKVTALVLCVIFAVSVTAFAGYEWAEDAVNYCVENKIMTGDQNGDLLLGSELTREQMAKILTESFNLHSEEAASFEDVAPERWSYEYINAFKGCMRKIQSKFYPAESVTREEFFASIVAASGLKESNVKYPTILSDNYDDYKEVDKDYAKLLGIAVEFGYVKGSGGKLRPKDKLVRAEACSVLYRVLESIKGNIKLELGVKQSSTPLVGEPQVTLEQAKKWAQSKGAAQRYIDVADIYWKYGEITGIRPEVLYAQAAKETGYGRYGGLVKPEQNNWSGIKAANAADGESAFTTFETPDDGVRAHFNHMCAYVGLEPVGEPHERYYSVIKISWAGTVKTVEELGGKWCPELYYGYNIVHGFIEAMQRF